MSHISITILFSITVNSTVYSSKWGNIHGFNIYTHGSKTNVMVFTTVTAKTTQYTVQSSTFEVKQKRFIIQ